MRKNTKIAKAKSRLIFHTTGGQVQYDILNSPEEVTEAVKRAMDNETTCTVYGTCSLFVVNPEDFLGGFAVVDLEKYRFAEDEEVYDSIPDPIEDLRNGVTKSREAYLAVRDMLLDDCETLLATTTEVADMFTLAADTVRAETVQKLNKVAQYEKMVTYIDDKLDGLHELYGEHLPTEITEILIYIKKWVMLLFSNAKAEPMPEPVASTVIRTLSEAAVAEDTSIADIDPVSGAFVVEA